MTAPADDWPADYQDQFWSLYPRRVSKIAAMKALDKVRKRGDVSWASIVAAIDRYKRWLDDPCWRPDPKHPATWLNQGCWDDELDGGRLEHAKAADNLGYSGLAATIRSRNGH